MYLDIDSKHPPQILKQLPKFISFNWPFSKIVKTNIGKMFFRLINRHFPKHHKVPKIFNKNTMKLSCYWRNIGSVIASHNRRIIKTASNNHGWNCRNRAECSLDNKCLTVNIVNKAVVSASSKPDKRNCRSCVTAETALKESHKRFSPQKVC